MLISCSACGGRHVRGQSCPNRVKAKRGPIEANYIRAFRNSKAWQNKRAEIKARDKMLCQLCLANGRYVFERLSVHHIRPIAKAWPYRLENENLITLCPTCHKMAEDGKIEASILAEMAKNADAF
jgi:5-methylcytosine-specific restriction protein A